MNPLPAPFDSPRRVLLGPGPSEVAPSVLRAMSQPLVGHLDPLFLKLMNETQAMLRALFQTSNPMTLPISGTGMAGMECALANLLEPGERILVCVNGVFGGRMADMAGRMNAQVRIVERPWGEVFRPEDLRPALAEFKPKLAGLVHAETSTGAWQPVPEIAKLCREHDALLLLDTVTSLGGLPVEIDAWGVDASYSGTQKCLSCPPGLSPATFGPRAMAALAARKTKCASWYLDLGMLSNYWGAERAYHHTAPIAMNYALHEACRVALTEGLPARFARHRRCHLALRAGLEALGLCYAAAKGHELPTLNAVTIPEGIDDLAVRKFLLEEYGIEIGGGLGAFKGKVWRIGLMGQGANPNQVLLVLGALEAALGRQGRRVGGAVAAANAAFAAA